MRKFAFLYYRSTRFLHDTRPVLLLNKAKKLRKETGDTRYYAPLEENSISFSQRLNKILATPFKVLVQEPILIALTVYMSVRYDGRAAVAPTDSLS